MIKKPCNDCIIIREYLSKCREYGCDSCVAQTFCITNDLREDRFPQSYCKNNIVKFLEERNSIHIGDIIVDEKLYEQEGNSATRYLVTNITESSYLCINGYDFEPVSIGKDYIKYYRSLNDRKDMTAIIKELEEGLSQDKEDDING